MCNEGLRFEEVFGLPFRNLRFLRDCGLGLAFASLSLGVQGPGLGFRVRLVEGLGNPKKIGYSGLR